MDGSQSNPKVYLIIENPKKSNNLGPIIRCAAAYSITQLVFVGYHKCSVEGSHGSNKYVDTTNFPTFSQAKEYVINEIGKPSNNDRDLVSSSSSSSSEESNIDFVGIMGAFECVSAVKENNIMDQTVPILQSKIEDGIFMNLLQHKSQKFDESKYQVEESLKSYPIHLRPFYGVGGNKKKIHDNSNDDKTITNRKHICFVISKNNRGFPKENADICNYFVHVPIASHLTLEEEEEEEKTNNNPISISSPYRFIDTQSCLSIVLHHFTAWTNCYKKGSFISQKYVTGNNNNDKGRGSSSIDRVEQQKKRKTQERQQKHKEEETFVDNALDGSWGDNLFDTDEE